MYIGFFSSCNTFGSLSRSCHRRYRPSGDPEFEQSRLFRSIEKPHVLLSALLIYSYRRFSTLGTLSWNRRWLCGKISIACRDLLLVDSYSLTSPIMHGCGCCSIFIFDASFQVESFNAPHSLHLTTPFSFGGASVAYLPAQPPHIHPRVCLSNCLELS